MARKRKTGLLRVPDSFKEYVKNKSEKENKNMTEIVEQLEKVVKKIERNGRKDPFKLTYGD